MLIGQVIGAALGVILTPLSFALFWKTGLVGVQDGPYPNPFAVIYRWGPDFLTAGPRRPLASCFLLLDCGLTP